jgi:hypothetical protein
MSCNGTGMLHFIQGTVNVLKHQEILSENLLPVMKVKGDLISQQEQRSDGSKIIA